MECPKITETDPMEVLTVPQAAAILKIHVKTAYRKIGEGEIPHVRLGKAIRVPKVALRRFLESGIGV